MTAPRPLGVDHLTVNGMPPLAFAALAAEAGCDAIGLFARRIEINPMGFPDWSLIDDAGLRRDLAKALGDLGLTLAIGEGCAIAPGREVESCRPILDAFAELQARRLNLISFEPDLARDFDQMARFAELAAGAGMDVCVEFSARPGRPKLDAFVDRIERTGMANLSALVDAMHFFGAGQSVGDLAAHPPGLFTHLQLCDIRWDAVSDYMEAALHERLPPGEGALPLVDLLVALPADVAVSLEVPQTNSHRSGVPPLERLRQAAEKSRAVLTEAAGQRCASKLSETIAAAN